MPRKLSNWFRKMLRTKNHEAGLLASEMPVLPSPRPRLLTPSPSRESLVESAAAATANSRLFQSLPADLRRQILIEAFGRRTVHMDLSFTHPMVPLTELDARTMAGDIRHCGLNCESNVLYHSPLKLDASKPKAWLWFSCVCHRDPECRVRGSGPVSEPWTDTCCTGAASSCRGWPGEKPEKCFLGIMGWLLSCRQAYTEGIEILYATNTIHMSSAVMIRHLPNLLRPCHLAMITSVEMIWQLNVVFRPSEAHDGTDAGREAFEAMLQAVPRALPNLRKFHVSLLGNWYPSAMSPNDRARESEADILAPVDDMVCRLGSQLQECNVGLPASIFHSRWESGIVQGLRFERGKYAWVSDRIWRPLPPAVDGHDAGKEETGYWIREGKDDMPYHFAHIVAD